MDFLKKKLLNGDRINRKKKRPDNRGKLDERFRSIWNIENKQYNVGWFEINTVFGKDHQSSVLVLVEQNNKNYFAMKLEKNNSS